MDLSMFTGILSYVMKDYLTLFFVFLIILIVIPIFIYSIGYINEYRGKYSVKYFWIILTLFVLSMLGVVLSNNSPSFIVFWELMSVSSFFLVIYEYKNKENLKTGIMYFIMTHISGLILMIMFALFYKYTGSMDFTYIIKHSYILTYSQKSIIIILAILGFGTKAGLVPLHVWLPKAHPVAPSNISALMSGIMLKIALYGFFRVTLMFINVIPIPYGILIMIIGAVTAIYCILNALFQNDIKKLLAYSSAENIGIIFSTLGLTMIFNAYGLHNLEILAITAALFHILNHAIFKSLLFTGAGSVLYATGSKNMNELGGLYGKMKFTAYCTFIGTAAIAAIPPLNGFASEILIFKSFIEAGVLVKSPGVVFSIFACGIVIAITSGCVMWAGVKSFGMTFLGTPRTEKAINIHQIPRTMKIGMGILSTYTIAFGIFSPFAITCISKIATSIRNINLDIASNTFGFEITIISIIFVIIFTLIHIVSRLTARNEKIEYNDTWGCGFNNLKPYMQYSGSGFTMPATRIAGNLVGYEKEVRIKNTVLLRQKYIDFIEKYLYLNIIKLFDYISVKIIKIHYGKIQAYISYVFISLIIALILVLKFV